MSDPVIAICMPLADGVEGATFQCVMALDIPRPFVLETRRGTNVADARNEIVGKVLFDPDHAKVTHLLWIDDDMTFSPDALRRLLAHDLPIVGGLCHGRRAPHYAPILCYRNPRGALGYTYRHEYPEGLVEVDATGAAFLLVKREVFETIEKEFPEPGVGPFTDHGRGVLGCGEDISFCERAKACGFKVFVDTSVKIGHLAETVVDEEFARRNRTAAFNPWFPPYPAAEKGKPVASIIIPTWNQRPAWLREAVASALAQTVPCEVIVVDDGSDRCAWCGEEAGDGQCLNEACPGFAFVEGKRVRYFATEHRGCFHALNAGIAAMRTEWFTWLSSDDILAPVKVERQLRATLGAEAKASFHGYHVLREGDKFDRQVYVPHVWRSIAEQQHILAVSCVINGLTAMIHKSVLDELRLPNGDYFDTRFTISSDWDAWNRIGQRHFWLPISEVLATRRDYDNASTRYQADPEKVARWQAEDREIRYRFAPRCPDCGVRL